MKKMFASLAAVFILLVAAPAFAEGSSYVNLGWSSSYVLGDGAKVYDKPVFQAEVGHDFGGGFGGSLWWSLPASLRNVDDNAATEVDLNGWYTHGVATVGAAYFFMSPDNSGAFYKNDVLQINGEVKKPLDLGGSFVITPGCRVEYDFPVSDYHNRQTTGLYVIPSLGISYAASKNIELGLMNKLNWDVYGGYGCGRALVVKVSPSVTCKVSKEISVSGKVDIYRSLYQSAGDIDRDHTVVAVGINYAF